MVNTGLSEVIGSWKIIDILFPRICCISAAGQEADPAKRTQEYQDAEKILVNDAAAAFITHQVVYQIWWPWLVGMHPDKTGNVVFRWLDIARFQMYIRNDVDQLKASM